MKAYISIKKGSIKKIAVFTALLLLANVNSNANELDDVIKNYYKLYYKNV